MDGQPWFFKDCLNSVFNSNKNPAKVSFRDMNIVNTIGISILAVFLLFVFQKKKKMMSDIMLIVTILIIAALFISEFWVRQGLTPINFVFEKIISFYILPAFMVYAMLLISKDQRIKKSWWWFGLVAYAFTIYILIDFNILTEYDAALLEDQYKSGTPIYHLFYRGSNVFAILALLWFLKKLKAHRKLIKDNYSFIESINLSWLSNFTWIYIINNALILLASLAFSYLHLGDLDLIYLIVFSSIVLSLFYLCYNGIRQYSMVEFDQAPARPVEKVEEVIANISKYETSSLSDDEMQSLFDKVLRLILEEKVYLEPELKVKHLADQLGTTSHNISQTINSKAGKSFYDFVNHHRLSHFKALLSDPDNQKFTILGLGFDSGFNSKASLNRIFKNQEGITPKEFQRQYQTQS